MTVIDSILNQLNLKARFTVESYHQLAPISSEINAPKCLLCKALKHGCHPLRAISLSTNGTEVFAADKTLELLKQEGEKITVVGKVINTSLHNSGNLFFINFGTTANVQGKYNSFTIVVPPKGLKNFAKINGTTTSDLQHFKGKKLQVTGILELITNKKGYTGPQILLEDPYQLKVLTRSEANDILKASTTNTSQPNKPTPPSGKSSQTIQTPAPSVNSVLPPNDPVSSPLPKQTLPIKPVPPPPRQAPPPVPESYRIESFFQGQPSSLVSSASTTSTPQTQTAPNN